MQQSHAKLVTQARRTKGYLEKQSDNFLKDWKLRYFIIIDDCLCYYEDEALQQLKKKIKILDMNQLALKGDQTFTFTIQDRLYELRSTSTKGVRDLWLASLTLIQEDLQATKEKADVQIFQEKDRAKTKNLDQLNKPIKNKIKSASPRKKEEQYSPKKKQELLEMNRNFSYQQKFFKKLTFKAKLLYKDIESRLLTIHADNGTYWLLSCKPLFPPQDSDFLGSELILPFELNTIYYFNHQTQQNRKLCRMANLSHCQAINNHSCIKLTLNNNTQTIISYSNQYNQNISQQIIDKLLLSNTIGCQVHNNKQITLRKNIQLFLTMFDRENECKRLIEQQFKKKLKIPQIKSIDNFLTNFMSLKQTLIEFMQACMVKSPPRIDLKKYFLKQFHVLVYEYLHTNWQLIYQRMSYQHFFALAKEIYDYWKLILPVLNDKKLLAGCQILIRIALRKEQQGFKELIKKLITEKPNGLYTRHLSTHNHSNRILCAFQVKLQQAVQGYKQLAILEEYFVEYVLFLERITNCLTVTVVSTFENWTNVDFLLGICNQFEEMKNYFENVVNFDTFDNHYRNTCLKTILVSIANVELQLIKKVFIFTFSTINRDLLNQKWDKLNINMICKEILNKLAKIQGLTKRGQGRLYQGSLQEIIFFYYNSLIKNKQQDQSSISVKIHRDISYISEHYIHILGKAKLTAKLQDLYLLQEFFQCNNHEQLKEMCKKVSRHFGTSINEKVVKTLIQLKGDGFTKDQKYLNECCQLLKASQQSSDSSLTESWSNSFNNRVRKSTLTGSLSSSMETNRIRSQLTQIVTNTMQGYLMKCKNKNSKSSHETRYYYRLQKCRLYQFEDASRTESINSYHLSQVQKSSIKPQKYILVLQFSKNIYKFKAETLEEANIWLKKIEMQKNCLCESESSGEDHADQELLFKDLYFTQTTKETYEKSFMQRSLEPSIKEVSPEFNDRKRKIPKEISASCSKGCFF